MRLPRLLAAASIAAGTVVAMSAGPAYADDGPACQYDYITYNACVRFLDTANVDVEHVVAGLDSYMPQGYAQEIVSNGGAFKASLWGDDGGNGHDTFIADLWVDPGSPLTGPDGLGADLSADVWRGYLNEDL